MRSKKNENQANIARRPCTRADLDLVLTTKMIAFYVINERKKKV